MNYAITVTLLALLALRDLAQQVGQEAAPLRRRLHAGVGRRHDDQARHPPVFAPCALARRVPRFLAALPQIGIARCYVDEGSHVGLAMKPFRYTGRGTRMIGYAGPANARAGEVYSKYVITDMYAKAVQGMPPEDAVRWAEGELKRVYEG